MLTKKVHIAMVGVTAVVVGIPTAFAVSSSATPAPKAQRGRISEAVLHNIEKNWAASTGDPSPRLIEHVSTARDRAVLLSSGGDRVSGAEAVYLVEMEGDFVGTFAHVPRGAGLPRGSVLTLVVDAYSGAVVDRGLSSQLPNIGDLGPVVIDS